MHLTSLIAPAVVTPIVLYIAMVAQRVAGPVSAGLVASLPLQSAIGALGVSMTSGDQAVADFSIVAATYIGAQVAYALGFFHAMRRKGFLAAVTAGMVSYSLAIFTIQHIPTAVAIACGLVSLVVGPRLIHMDADEVAALPPSESNSGIVVGIGTLGVVSVILLVGFAGPTAGAFMAAVPVITPILAYFLSRDSGPAAGAQTMVGLVRGLPMYSAFSITLALLAKPLGTETTVGIGMAICFAIAAVIWKFASASTLKYEDGTELHALAA